MTPVWWLIRLPQTPRPPPSESTHDAQKRRQQPHRGLKSGGGPNNGNLQKYVGPGIALDWLEIEGPLLDHWPTVAHQRLFGDLPLVTLPEMPKQRGLKKSRKSEPAGGDIHNPHRPPTSAYALAAHGKEFIENLNEVPKSVEYASMILFAAGVSAPLQPPEVPACRSSVSQTR